MYDGFVSDVHLSTGATLPYESVIVNQRASWHVNEVLFIFAVTWCSATILFPVRRTIMLLFFKQASRSSLICCSVQFDMSNVLFMTISFVSRVQLPIVVTVLFGFVAVLCDDGADSSLLYSSSDARF